MTLNKLREKLLGLYALLKYGRFRNYIAKPEGPAYWHLYPHPGTNNTCIDIDRAAYEDYAILVDGDVWTDYQIELITAWPINNGFQVRMVGSAPHLTADEIQQYVLESFYTYTRVGESL